MTRALLFVAACLAATPLFAQAGFDDRIDESQTITRTCTVISDLIGMRSSFNLYEIAANDAPDSVVAVGVVLEQWGAWYDSRFRWYFDGVPSAADAFDAEEVQSNVNEHIGLEPAEFAALKDTLDCQ